LSNYKAEIGMRKFLILAMICTSFRASSQVHTYKQYRQDFEFFWNTVKENYAYWDKKQTDWQKVYTFYSYSFDTVSNKHNFILLLEKVVNELYDHHFSLTANTLESQRLVPSGADLWTRYSNGKPIITEVRQGSGAAKKGIKEGMEVIAVNDIPVSKAILPYLPKELRNDDAEAHNYALRVLLAGIHKIKRKITTLYKGKTQDFYPDDPINLLEDSNNKGLLESKIIGNHIGYIKILNSLGNNDLIHAFDSVLNTLSNTSSLVLDLRETPGGGNTTVARSIMGHFIKKEGLYQKHELPSEQAEFGVKRSWIEIVSPRKPYYSKPLVILADHWTGSVAEGITIGFDALKRAIILGSQMAGLNGAVYSFNMPNSNIGFALPSEKLFHVNGTPREKFKPGVLIDLLQPHSSNDLFLDEALAYLKKHTTK
jgi:C-terminal processing protease CtpA/Prc